MHVFNPVFKERYGVLCDSVAIVDGLSKLALAGNGGELMDEDNRWDDKQKDMIDMWMEDILTHANQMMEAHEEFRAYENNRRKIDDRSFLRPFVRRRGTTSVSIVWKVLSFRRGRNGEWETTSMEINKGKGTKYPLQKLFKHTKGWEMEMVAEAEEFFAVLREEARALKRQWLAHLDFVRTNDKRNLAVCSLTINKGGKALPWLTYPDL